VPPPRGVLFDFDGTLYGDWRLWIATVQATLQAFQVDITAHHALEKARSMIRDGSFVNISGVAIAIARDEGVDKDQEIRTAFFEKIDDAMDASGPGNDLLSLLNNLKSMNFRLGLVTFVRKPRLMRRLDKWGMSQFFSSIMTPERFEKFKPSPEPFLEAIKELDLPSSSCSAVGDEPVDMTGASTAGLQAIGLPNGFFSEDELRQSGASLIIQSLSELPHVLQGSSGEFDATRPVR
jgi:phosphoglycolate phosphatase-like HAD superfamily hydrolase